MTAQIPDLVRLGDDEYVLAGVAGTGLFAPADHGLEPQPVSTGCWRGYVCTYAATDDRLVVAGLRLSRRTDLHGRPLAAGDPLLGGTIVAVPPAAAYAGEGFAVDGIAWPVPYTGTLLLGRDLVAAGPHMGHTPAWRYARVVELTVEAGAVRATADLSDRMAATREAIGNGAAPDPDGPPGTGEWVARTFGLGYDRAMPPTPPPRPPG